MKKRSAELLLLLSGAFLLLKGGWNMANYAAFQSHPDWYVSSSGALTSTMGKSQLLLPVKMESGRSLQSLSGIHVIGKLEVRRLGMSVLVVEGDDENELSLAAGHVAGTAKVGELGNAVIAGHRDTSFWPLRKIRIGDKVQVRSGKNYEYVVSSVRIVGPDDLTVLNETRDRRTLTLVTCYPFRYFGSAPKRYIVQATMPIS